MADRTWNEMFEMLDRIEENISSMEIAIDYINDVIEDQAKDVREIKEDTEDLIEQVNNISKEGEGFEPF
jgi:archaellum component FlaC